MILHRRECMGHHTADRALLSRAHTDQPQRRLSRPRRQIPPPPPRRHHPRRRLWRRNPRRGGHVPRRPLHRHRQDRHHRHLPRAADGDAGRGDEVNPYRHVIIGTQKQLLTHPSARWARLLKILGRYPMPSPLSRGRGTAQAVEGAQKSCCTSHISYSSLFTLGSDGIYLTQA